MTKMIIELPFFPGFYESPLMNGDTAYWAIKDELEYQQKDLGEDTLTEDNLEFDYDSFKFDVSQSFIRAWKFYSPNIVEDLEYDSLWSPKYYNYENDRLFAKLELAEEWKDEMSQFISNNADWLKERILKDWTSYDGFVSFMSTDLSEWEHKLFTEEDVRYVAIMIGYMMYREDKEVRNRIIESCLEDVYPSAYVNLIERI